MLVKKADVTRIKPEKTWVGRGGGGERERKVGPALKKRIGPFVVLVSRLCSKINEGVLCAPPPPITSAIAMCCFEAIREKKSNV